MKFAPEAANGRRPTQSGPGFLVPRRHLLTAGAAGAFLALAGNRPARAAGTNYYVSPSGDDGAPGTQARPFKSIQRAFNAVAAGDKVIVEDGAYNEAPVLTTSGMAGAPITIIAQNAGKAKVTAAKDAGYTVSLNASYIVFSGLDVTNVSTNGGGIGQDSATGGAILNCRVHDCGGNGIGVTNSDDTMIAGNIVFGNATRSITESNSGISVWQSRVDPAGRFGVYIGSNLVHDNFTPPSNSLKTDGNGIIIDGPRTNYNRPIVIENNICHHNGGKGILILHSRRALVNVRFNTCYMNALSTYLQGDRAEIENSLSIGSVIANNIFHGTGQPGTFTAANYESSRSVWARNCAFNGALRPGLSKLQFLTADPLFRSPTSFDFRLDAGSPCIGFGTAQYGVPRTDFSGNPRGPRLDLGALQYAG